MIPGPICIKLQGHKRIVIIAIGGTNRAVRCKAPKSVKHCIQHELTVNPVFHCTCQMPAGDTVQLRRNRQRQMLVSSDTLYLDSVVFRTGVTEMIGDINTALLKSGASRGKALKGGKINLVKPPCLTLTVMVLHPPADKTLPRLETFNPVKSGANTLGHRLRNLASRIHQQMIIGQQIGEIRIAPRQLEPYLMQLGCAHLCNHRHQSPRRRGHFWIKV